MPRSWIAAAGSACLFGAAAPVSCETLAEAISLAYRTNPTLQAGRYDLRAADEDLVQARSYVRLQSST